MKVVTVLGARPQFIKASAVSVEISKHAELEEIVVHTGQHFDANMSDIFFAELGMAAPRFNLDIHGGTHGVMTGRMLEGVERILIEEKPDVVLVYGDTNSTLAGALAGAKLHIPVAHVEAGLRSFNMRMPEEINRVLTDRVSTWLFAPTSEAVNHLRNEGIDLGRIVNVGDVMYDVALLHGRCHLNSHDGVLAQYDLQLGGYVLVTVHRAENTDVPERLRVIVDALTRVGSEFPVVWPLHPRTRAVLEGAGLIEMLAKSVLLIEPLGYMDMVKIERGASVIATDSGGVQKEAFFHGVPCITLRDETEWVELVEAGWNQLTPPIESVSVADAILAARGRYGQGVQPYGQGDASVRIVKQLLECRT